MVLTFSIECSKTALNKHCTLRILLSQKWKWRFIQVFLRSRADSNPWSKKWNTLNVLKSYFLRLLQFPSSSSEYKISKNGAWNCVWINREEHTSSSLYVAFEVWCENWQKSTNSENSAKCRKRSQRINLSFTWLGKYL